MAKYGNLPKGMAQQLQALQRQLEEAQRELAEAEVTGSAGGGAVQVVLRGDQHCLQVQVSPDLLADGDVEMLQDLLVAAFNNAQEALAKMTAERLGPFSSMLG